MKHNSLDLSQLFIPTVQSDNHLPANCYSQSSSGRKINPNFPADFSGSRVERVGKMN